MSSDALIFEIAAMRAGLWCRDVLHVDRIVEISPIPGAPAPIEGVIDYRGSVLAVLDIRAIMRLPPKPLDLYDHLVFLSLEDRDIAIRVEHLEGVVDLPDDSLEATTIVSDGLEFTGTIATTSSGLIHILDPRRLLTAQTSASIDQWVNARLPETAA